jgi:hypothetical protein
MIVVRWAGVKTLKTCRTYTGKKALMPNNKPWLDGPTAKDRAIAKMWQGGPCIVIGGVITAMTYYLLGRIWIMAVIIGIAGVFWFAAGLITYITGVE